MLADIAPALRVSGRKLRRQASDNIEMLRALGRDPLYLRHTRLDGVAGLVELMTESQAAAPGLRLPMLVLLGARDQIVPPQASRRFVATLPPEQLLRRHLPQRLASAAARPPARDGVRRHPGLGRAALAAVAPGPPLRAGAAVLSVDLWRTPRPSIARRPAPGVPDLGRKLPARCADPGRGRGHHRVHPGLLDRPPDPGARLPGLSGRALRRPGLRHPARRHPGHLPALFRPPLACADRPAEQARGAPLRRSRSPSRSCRRWSWACCSTTS